MNVEVSVREVQALASSARLQFEGERANHMRQQLAEVLTYVSMLQKFQCREGARQHEQHCAIVRTDSVSPVDAQAIVHCSPAHEEGFFTVPAVLSSSHREVGS